MEHEIGHRIRASRWSSILLITSLTTLVVASAGLFLFARDPYSAAEIRRLIEQGYNTQRPGGGRLYKAAYSRLDDSPIAQTELGKAQLLLLRHPDLETKHRLQGVLYLASGDWQKYVEAVPHLSTSQRGEPSVLNDLGVSYLALSDKDPSYLLNALEQFERAAQLSPKATAPRFNLVITYRRLHFHDLADKALEDYKLIEAGSPWYRELTGRNSRDKSLLLDQLRLAVVRNDIPDAERLFQQDPDFFRQVLRQYGAANAEESPNVVHFIASEMDKRYGDKTFSAMLAPLFTDQRQTIIALRQFVTEGAELFVKGDLDGSLRAYAKADQLAEHTDSLFDALWIDLNRVDTQIRAGKFESAREALQRIVSLSRKNDYRWLMGKALSVYGSTKRLTGNFREMMDLLAEATHIFRNMGADNDRVRPLYYSAFYQYGAGAHDEGLKLALECLRLTDDRDSFRLAELDWLIGLILYNQGTSDKAALFEQQSLEQAQKISNPAVEADASIALAQLYESASDHKRAQQYIAVADQALHKMPPGFDQIKVDQWVTILKANIALNEKRYQEAELLLEKTLEINSQLPFRATLPRSQSLMLLARSYSETGRTRQAAQTFNEAIELVESDDQYLQSEKLRVKFDDERRDLYDSAIEFEYNNGSPDGAWLYLQKYRSKLFIEFLAQFDPNVEQAHSEALDRLRVQKLLPSDAQIVEYALLKNRLLIWVISKEKFTVRSVQIARSEVESSVQKVLQGLRNRDDVDSLLIDLGKVLVEPVADLLDRNRTLVVVPDRALHGLPFGVIRRPGRPQYLLQEFPILISPNLTHLLLTKAAEPRRDRITGFGSQNGTSSELKELGALASIYPKSQTFSGREADKSNFLSEISKAAVFHYAGHSAKDAVDPLRSAILLDGNTSGRNSITAVDIAQQRLSNNALIVLSSCDSSVGNSRDGIGLRGLTSAFLLGGAGSVVGSLWPVEASSTADLMIRFHRAFANSKIPVAKALQQAQLTFLESFPERSHPYYWSGFVVTGNFSALR